MDLLKVAHAFRVALDEQKIEQILPAHMARFPARCCGVLTELLGEYLDAAGVNSTYILGKKTVRLTRGLKSTISD